jgi:hypothetical protein
LSRKAELRYSLQLLFDEYGHNTPLVGGMAVLSQGQEKTQKTNGGCNRHQHSFNKPSVTVTCTCNNASILKNMKNLEQASLSLESIRTCLKFKQDQKNRDKPDFSNFNILEFYLTDNFVIYHKWFPKCPKTQKNVNYFLPNGRILKGF